MHTEYELVLYIYIYIYNITYLVRGKKIMNIMINLDDLSPFTVSGL